MNALKKAFFGFWFRVFGWRVQGNMPDLKKYVIIVAPHTSNIDFFVGLAAKHIIDLHTDFIGKDSLFKAPVVGWFMRSIGGHPVDRSRSNNLVDAVAELFASKDRFVMTLAPEGTRSYVENWKTGFYRIAEKARVPIVMVGFDYPSRTVQIKEPFYPTGDLEGDMDTILSFFRGVIGRVPENGVR